MTRDELALLLIDGLIMGLLLQKNMAPVAAKLRTLFARLAEEGRDLNAEEMGELRADAGVADLVWATALARARERSTT